MPLGTFPNSIWFDFKSDSLSISLPFIFWSSILAIETLLGLSMVIVPTNYSD